MDISSEKEKLRKQLLKQRKAIAAEEFSRASRHIIRQLSEQPEFNTATVIHCYVSMNSRREVNTHSLIKEMLSQGKKVVVPVTNFVDGTLKHVLLSSFDILQKNKWGVLEPTSGERVSTEQLELVIVPMVGGDEEGNRMGYGEGFYDRFLSNVSCPKIGLLFEQNVIDALPVADYDIPLDKIITEQRVIVRN